MNHRVINVDCHNVHRIQAAGGVGGLNPSPPMDGPPICHAFIMLGKSYDIPTILLDLAMGCRLRSNVRVPTSKTLVVFVKKLFCRDPCRNQNISGLKQKKGAATSFHLLPYSRQLSLSPLHLLPPPLSSLVPHHPNAAAAATATCHPPHAAHFRLRFLNRPPPRASILDNLQYQLPE
jgi:hypothetical protein